MSYKIVRRADGSVVCYGPNTPEYQPVIQAGWTLAVEPVIPPKTQAEIDAETSNAARLLLAKIDAESIRSIREYIAAKADAPQILKDKDAAAAVERAKIRP